jgi:tRNA G37 N-methylase TrmD
MELEWKERKIEEWRMNEAINKTRERRPDLLDPSDRKG